MIRKLIRLLEEIWSDPALLLIILVIAYGLLMIALISEIA